MLLISLRPRKSHPNSCSSEISKSRAGSQKALSSSCRCSQSPVNTSTKGDDVKGDTSSSGPSQLSCRLKFPSVHLCLLEILCFPIKTLESLDFFPTCFISGLPVTTSVNFNEDCSVKILKLFSKNTVLCQSNQALQGTLCRWNYDRKMKKLP